MYDVIVLGGGPAGVSAAVYAKSRGKNVLLIEKNKIGGLIGAVSRVSHYASVQKDETGPEFAEKLRRQLIDSQIEIRYEEVLSADIKSREKSVTTANDTYKSKAVVIAMGCEPKKLPVENADKCETSAPVIQSAEQCIGKICVVSGGSDGAAKEALYLANYAEEVHMVQIMPELMCINEFSEALLNKDNIKVHLSSEIKEIDTENGKISKIVLNSPEGDVEIISDDIHVFTYIGQKPNTEMFKGVLKLENGYIKTDGVKTDVDGVFACGDICVKDVRQVATAVSDGALAGIAAAHL